MAVEIIAAKVPSLWPITAEVNTIKVGGIRIADLILSRFPALPDNRTVAVRGDFLPSLEFAALLATGAGNCVVKDASDGATLAEVTIPGRLGVTELPLGPAFAERASGRRDDQQRHSRHRPRRSHPRRFREARREQRDPARRLHRRQRRDR